MASQNERGCLIGSFRNFCFLSHSQLYPGGADLSREFQKYDEYFYMKNHGRRWFYTASFFPGVTLLGAGLRATLPKAGLTSMYALKVCIWLEIVGRFSTRSARWPSKNRYIASRAVESECFWDLGDRWKLRRCITEEEMWGQTQRREGGLTPAPMPRHQRAPVMYILAFLNGTDNFGGPVSLCFGWWLTWENM